MNYKKKKTPSQIKSGQVKAGTLMDFIPKMCTDVNFQVLNTKDVVVTLIYKDSPKSNPIIIERVILGFEHAKNVQKVLTKVITEVENDNR